MRLPSRSFIAIHSPALCFVGLLLVCRTSTARTFSSYSIVTTSSYHPKSSAPRFSRRRPPLDRRRASTAPPLSKPLSAVLLSNAKATVPVENPERPLSYQDLTPVGRVVAGTIEVAIVTILEYISGLFGGYVLGSVTDLPRLLFRPVEGVAANEGWKQVSSRLFRMHQKSLRWGTSWAEISAICGGMNVACRVLRGGVEDEWNTVIGSMAAGAFFRRNEGPQAMLSGAVVYGALVYLLSGGGLLKKEPFQYKEQPIEF